MKKDNINSEQQKLVYRSIMAKEKGYRYELFENSYLEFDENRKLNWKFGHLDSEYENATFPIAAEALAKLTRFMHGWMKDVGLSRLSPYFVAKYFDNFSFTMIKDAISTVVFFPFENDKQWVNLFWILLRLNKPCIETLLGQLYSDTEKESRASKITELNDLLSSVGYTVQPRMEKRVYVEIMRIQESYVLNECEVETQKGIMYQTNEMRMKKNGEIAQKNASVKRPKKTQSGMQSETLEKLAVFIVDWSVELYDQTVPSFFKYMNPYWFIPKRKRRKDLCDYLPLCNIEQIFVVIECIYGDTKESQKSKKLDGLNKILNKEFYEIRIKCDNLVINKIETIYL